MDLNFNFAAQNHLIVLLLTETSSPVAWTASVEGELVKSSNVFNIPFETLVPKTPVLRKPGRCVDVAVFGYIKGIRDLFGAQVSVSEAIDGRVAVRFLEFTGDCASYMYLSVLS